VANRKARLPQRFVSLSLTIASLTSALPAQDDLVTLHVLSARRAQHRAWLSDRRIGGALPTTIQFTEALAPRSPKRSPAAREPLSMSFAFPFAPRHRRAAIATKKRAKNAPA
jgi:hypothetical protein